MNLIDIAIIAKVESLDITTDCDAWVIATDCHAWVITRGIDSH